MVQAQLRPDYLTGAARVAGVSGDLAWSCGIITGCTRQSAGIYHISAGSEAELSALVNSVVVTPLITDTGEYGWGYNFVDELTIEVRTLANGAPFDLDFTVEIHRVRDALEGETLPPPAPAPPPPSSVVPGGGLTRQVLSIDGSSAMAWNYVENLLPTGYSLLPTTGATLGTIYYYNVGWAAAPTGVPGGASNGQFLGYSGGTPTWQSIIQVPAGGVNGQFLGYSGGAPAWVAAPTGLPAGGTQDQIVSLVGVGLTPTWITLAFTRNNTFTVNSDAATSAIETAAHIAIASTTVNSDLVRTSWVTDAGLATMYLRTERSRAAAAYADIAPILAVGVPGSTSNLQSTIQWNSGNGSTAFQAGIQLIMATANAATRRYLSPTSGDTTSGSIMTCAGLVADSVTIGYQSYGAGSSVVIGNAAVSTGNNTTAIGRALTCSGTNSLFMGLNGVGSSNSNSVVIGNSFNMGSGGTRNVGLGDGVSFGATNTRTICIGAGSQSGGSVDRGIAIGDSTSVFVDDTIALGAFISVGAGTTTRTAVIGGAGASAGEWTLILGMDHTLAAPQAARFQPSFPNGSNIAGSAMRILGGISTGSGVGGSITLETCNASGSSSVMNTPTKMLEVTGDRKLAFFAATPVVRPTAASMATLADVVTALQNYGLFS